MEPPSGFDHGTPGLGIQGLNHKAIAPVCLELFIDQPTNLSAQALTWSIYKSHNTAKFLIGVTPQGTICFISKRRGGTTSDKFITENSNFLKYVPYGDVIMADRGFNIAETLGTFAATVRDPQFYQRSKPVYNQRKLKKQEPLQMFEFMLNV